MTQNKHQSGFTLVELLLAMAFFTSILLIATLLLVQILNMYTKGITVSQINQVGRTFVEELTRKSNAGSDLTTGVGCVSVDDISYVWNITDYASAVDNDFNVVYTYDDLAHTPVNFAKVEGASGCSFPGGIVPKANATALLSDNVRVYSVSADQIGTKLVHFKMVLGTYMGVGHEANVQIVTGPPQDFFCKPASSGQFCAMGTMDTVLYLPNGLE